MTLYKESNFPIIRMEVEAIEQLESDLITLQSILISRHGCFKSEAQRWQNILGDT